MVNIINRIRWGDRSIVSRPPEMAGERAGKQEGEVFECEIRDDTLRHSVNYSM